jgi:hypothetical protein
MIRRRESIGRIPQRLAVYLIVLSSLLSASQMLAADVVEVRSLLQAGSLKISFFWPTPVGCLSSIKGRELALQFDQPLQAPQIETLRARYPSWIDGIASGYDSVLILAARDVKYEVVASGLEVAVVLAPAPPAQAPSADQTQGRLRLELQQVRLYAGRGRLDKAHALAMRLQKEHPEDLSVLSGLASIEKQIGRWRRSDQLLAKAQKREPENGDLQAARRDIRSEQASRIFGDEESKTVPGQWSELITRLGGHALITGSLRAGANYDLNQVQANSVQRADGSQGSFDGTLHRGEFFLQNDFTSGLQLRGSLYRGETSTGGGFGMAYPDYYGRTTLQADFQRPFWEFIEGIADGGVRDRVELRRTLRIGSRWNGWMGVSGNRYGIEDDQDVARSVGSEAGLNFLITRSNPQLGVEYGFDMEHRLSIDSRTTQTGEIFFPIPLRNREVHSLSGVVGAQLLPELRTDGYGGFSYDRLGGNGPFMGLRLTYDRKSDFGAQLWFDRRLNSVNTGETVNRFGGRLLWRF